MSADSQSGDDLKERVTSFLRRNFPQIQMHGGSASITNIDRETGEVDIQLSGACSGCGISPMTVQAIKSRMTQEIPEVEKVNANTGMGGADHGAGMSPSFPGETTDDAEEDEGPQAPF